jgi:hypothetical protein
MSCISTPAISRAARALAACFLLLAPAAAAAQQANFTAPRAAPRHPFAPGERLTYEVRFGPLKVGTGTMEVRGIEQVRGRPAYHTVFRVEGGTSLYKVDDTFESWFAVDDLSSLRYHQDQNEGSKERQRRYEIFPERALYDEMTDDKPAQPSVDTPLDDGSFIYYMRTMSLEVGMTYLFDRYFKPDRNPVRIKALRRERVTVPAGTFNAIVVQPLIKAKGIFSEGGNAEVWFSDDSRRLMLQMRSNLSFGSLNLYLTSVTP